MLHPISSHLFWKQFDWEQVSLLALLILGMGYGGSPMAIACIESPDLSSPPVQNSPPTAKPEALPQFLINRVLDDFSRRMEIDRADLSILRHTRNLVG
jgi:hypothetical protein